MNYSNNETVTITLERYEDMKREAEGSYRRLRIGEIAQDKLRELGYVAVYHENKQPEYWLKEEWENSPEGKKQKEWQEANTRPSTSC